MNARPPILLFAFNRPDHTAQALAALKACRGASESDLVILVDGPRTKQEQAACDRVADLAASADGFRSLGVRRSPVNQGLFRAITTGVGETLRRFDSVIVVEDDMVVGEDFLDYMAGELARYADDPRVGCIHAYALPVGHLPDFYFLRGGDCWGWGTWRDRWALFQPDARRLLKQLADSGSLVAFMGSHGATSLLMLCRRASGRNQSWAILWHASLFLAGRFTLHPGRSFVINIGNDGSGTHAASTQRYQPEAGTSRLPDATIVVAQDECAARAISAFMDGCADGTPRARFVLGLKRAHAALYARWTLWRLAHRKAASRTTV